MQPSVHSDEEQFQITASMDDSGRATLRIVGQLDLVTEPELQSELDRLLVRGPAELCLDLSSATFFLVAALLVKESNLVIHGVGLNPTRSSLLDFLVSIGANIRILDLQQSGGEVIGDLRVQASRVKGGVIEGALTAGLIDEIPALAVLGAASENGLTVRDAAELRVKETDRIATIEMNLKRMGVAIESTPGGFHVGGRQQFHAAEIDSCGDHRIAMAFSVAALAADGPCIIDGSECAGVSFPEFFSTLRQIAS